MEFLTLLQLEKKEFRECQCKVGFLNNNKLEQTTHKSLKIKLTRSQKTNSSTKMIQQTRLCHELRLNSLNLYSKFHFSQRNQIFCLFKQTVDYRYLMVIIDNCSSLFMVIEIYYYSQEILHHFDYLIYVQILQTNMMKFILFIYS